MSKPTRWIFRNAPSSPMGPRSVATHVIGQAHRVRACGAVGKGAIGVGLAVLVALLGLASSASAAVRAARDSRRPPTTSDPGRDHDDDRPRPERSTLSASRSQIDAGQTVTLSGRASNVPAGTRSRLYKSPYPYPVAKPFKSTRHRRRRLVQRSRRSPDRNTRYRVVLVGTAASSAVVQVLVAGRQITKVTAITLGRANVTIVIFHPVDLRWGSARVSWSFALGPRPVPATLRATLTKKVSRHVIIIRTKVALPAGHFRWRVCFHAPGDHALLNPRRPPGCTGPRLPRRRLPAGRLPGPWQRRASGLVPREPRRAHRVRGRSTREGRMSGVHDALDVRLGQRRQGDAAGRPICGASTRGASTTSTRSATRSCTR